MAEVKDELNPKNKKDNLDTDYWRSFKELFKDTQLLESKHHEFGKGVKDDFDPEKLKGLSRRKFLALVSASAALAGAGCTDYRLKGHIVPYNHMPEEITVGDPTYYASTSTACSHACGVLIKTREGRPIKVDGNPDHPVSKGKTCAKCQASIINLYDPDRLESPFEKSGSDFLKRDWKVVDDAIITALDNSTSKQIAIIAHPVVSPTGKKVLDDFAAKYPNTKVYTYDLFNESSRNSAWKKCYGTDQFPLIKWNEAKIILGLETDFLGTEGDKVETARLFSEGRNFHNTGSFNRLYVFEGCVSVTGMNADYRLRLRPDAQYEFVLSLLSELSGKGINIPAGSQAYSGYSLNSFAKKYALPIKKLNLLVEDLMSNQGSSLIYAGRTLPENVHVAVNLLNEALGNTKLYRTEALRTPVSALSSKEELSELVHDMNAGNVAVVIHYDSDPVYHLPKDLGYEEAVKKVPMTISMVGSSNDSSASGNYTLPVSHDFESWGDAKTRTGFYSMQQPVIDPIFDTRQKEAILLTWLKGKPVIYDAEIYHKYLMNNWKQNIYPGLNSKLSFTEFWNAALHDGIVIFNETPASLGSFDKTAADSLSKPEPNLPEFVVGLRESYQAGD